MDPPPPLLLGRFPPAVSSTLFAHLVLLQSHVCVLPLPDRSRDGERWRVCRDPEAAGDNSIFKYNLQACQSNYEKSD